MRGTFYFLAGSILAVNGALLAAGVLTGECICEDEQCRNCVEEEHLRRSDNGHGQDLGHRQDDGRGQDRAHIDEGSQIVATPELIAEQQAAAAGAVAAQIAPLGQLNPRAPFTYYGDNPSSGTLYQGVWGYADGTREYALLTHGSGLSIIEVTNPSTPTELCFIAMPGGRIHRDVDVHDHYAYVGGQETSNLYVLDLSVLPSSCPAQVDLGHANDAHTLQIREGLLFLNGASTIRGCKILDVAADPLNPPQISQWNGWVCHDSYARDDILYSSEGSSDRWSLIDLLQVRTDGSLFLLGQTPVVSQVGSSIYAHSGHLSEDGCYWIGLEENNRVDIAIYDVCNTPDNPSFVTTLQWDGDAAANSIVHNAEVKDDYLHVAYYQAGYRLFDISGLPAQPVEIGHYETWRDPDGDGTFDDAITGNFDGAWNVYLELPSGNVLISDTKSGLFIFPPPLAPATFCGDAACQVYADEDCSHCSFDCGSCVTFWCGDGFCNGSENCSTCEADCGVCPFCVPDGQGQPCSKTTNCCSGLGNCTKGKLADRVCAEAQAICGDGAIGSGEECDGSDLGGQTCQSLGFDGGVLACNSSCVFDSSQCTGGTCADVGVSCTTTSDCCPGLNCGGRPGSRTCR